MKRKKKKEETKRRNLYYFVNVKFESSATNKLENYFFDNLFYKLDKIFIYRIKID